MLVCLSGFLQNSGIFSVMLSFARGSLSVGLSCKIFVPNIIMKTIISIILIIPLSFAYADDLSNNTVSITVNADTLVIRSFEYDFEISDDSEVDAGFPYSLEENYGLEGSVIVNSVVVSCNTVSSCATGNSFSINTDENITLIGEGIINSIIVRK
jgi:hypothetical protein